MSNSNEIFVLHNGYSEFKANNDDSLPVMRANCSCTLIRNASYNVIVDTMTPWDTEKIKESLKEHNLTPDQIDYVVCTHGHADHVGNNNLFLNATHIVGYSVSKRDEFYLHPFEEGTSFFIGGKDDISRIEVTPTPGHTMDSISVIVKTKNHKTGVIAGDLFEKEQDLKNSYIWLEAGSEDKKQQEYHRLRMLDIADFVVPGHGPKFEITDKTKSTYQKLS